MKHYFYEYMAQVPNNRSIDPLKNVQTDTRLNKSINKCFLNFGIFKYSLIRPQNA